MENVRYEDLFVEVCSACRMVQRERRDGFEFHHLACRDLNRQTRVSVYTSVAAALLDGPVYMPPQGLADVQTIGEA